jgi:NADH-quinone oxidoreductase subunit H
MISYELSLILSILAVVALCGTLNLREIVEQQARSGNIWDWNIFQQPLACFLLVVASFAETNRHPFDFAECEPELVAGFNTEYSAMKWAIFFIGEYSAMTVMSSLNVILFRNGRTRSRPANRRLHPRTSTTRAASPKRCSSATSLSGSRESSWSGMPPS